MINFNNTSLALLKDNKILFSSDKAGLRPLVECVNRNTTADCILYDKVIGLAAARLIVYSGLISEVVTLVCSKPAKQLLEENDIHINFKKAVDNILTQDRTSVCPLELRASKITDNEKFFTAVRSLFRM